MRTDFEKSSSNLMESAVLIVFGVIAVVAVGVPEVVVVAEVIETELVVIELVFAANCYLELDFGDNLRDLKRQEGLMETD